ncbi:hypothetical protein [Streptomyces sp. NPDC051183]|uniref:hypothetical protein n=1 Tax=Streptomyces sp. NPDC051183 TaxID=3155165 RepID=UPI0034231BB2
MTTPRPSTPTQRKVKEAMDARDALATALTKAGIQIPAMDIRTPWAEGSRYAFVHLGQCSAPVAHALAEVITRGASR